MNKTLHWLAHLCHLNSVYLSRKIIDGHEWMTLVCLKCGDEKKYIHSIVCSCKEKVTT